MASESLQAPEAGAPPLPTSSHYRFGIFEFDPRSCELRKAGVRVRLRLQPGRALGLLLARHGQVVSREEMRALLWPGDTHVDFDQGLNYCVKEVRAAIGDNAEAPTYIETLPRLGYRWVGPAESLAPRRGRAAARAPIALAFLAGALLAAGLAAISRWPEPASPLRWSRLTFRRGAVEAARFAPGGEVLYTAAFDGQPLRLHAGHGGAPEHRVLDLPAASLVGVSVRGEVFFLGDRSGRAGRQLLRAPLGAGTAKVLADGVLVADVTPDGVEVAAVRAPEGLVGQRLEFPLGREVGRPNSASALRISPDGRRVAIVEHPLAGQEGGHLVVFDREGRARALGGDWAAIDGIAWSPRADGVFLTGSRPGAGCALYRVGLDGAVSLRLAVGGRAVLHDVAADGRFLVERTSLRGEMRFAREGQPERDLGWLDRSRPAALSDDGETLLFVEAGEGGGPDQATYLRATRGGSPVRLSAGRGTGLSADGRTAFVIPSGVAPDHLEAIPVGAGPARPISLPGVDWVQWAFPMRDGRLAVVGAERGHHMRVWVAALDGSGAAPVTPEHFVTSWDTVSADGRFLVAGCPVRTFCLYRTDGGRASPIPGLDDLVPIRFDASGRHLFARSRGSLPVAIERLEVATGRRTPWRTIAPEDPQGVASIGTVTLTPDGRAWAYGFDRKLSELYLLEGLGP